MSLNPRLSTQLLNTDYIDEICDHLLSLSEEDRRFRFLNTLSDEAVCKYVHQINFSSEQILGVLAFNTHLGKPKLAGIAHLIPNKTQHYVEIAISVNKIYRRCGCAKMLIDTLIVWSKKNNYKKITLNCSYRNIAMTSLLKKFNFVFNSNEYDSEFECFLEI